MTTDTEMQRIFNNVFKTPIKNLIRLETEYIKDTHDIALKLSLNTHSTNIITIQPTSSEYQTKNKIDYALIYCEQTLYTMISNFIIKAIASDKRTIPSPDMLLYGMPFAIINDLNIENESLIILSPKKYHALREHEANSRQGIIFTR